MGIEVGTSGWYCVCLSAVTVYTFELFFFFKQKTAYEMRISDWSSDVCSSDLARCRSQLQAMLIMMSRPGDERGGTGERAFLAFKLHRFISGAGHVYATLHGPGRRRVTLDGQRFDPQDRKSVV